VPSYERDVPLAEQDRQIDEQRRLFYVAITRSTATLVLSSVMNIPRDMAYRMGVLVRGGCGDMARTVACPFIGELGSNRARPILGMDLPR
jgi:superfamily I DNA/RNA helicase